MSPEMMIAGPLFVNALGYPNDVRAAPAHVLDDRGGVMHEQIVVVDLVQAHAHEVGEHQLRDRAQAPDRGADRVGLVLDGGLLAGTDNSSGGRRGQSSEEQRENNGDGQGAEDPAAHARQL